MGLLYEFDEIKNLLSNLGKDWSFNMFFLEECTQKPLEITGLYFIKKWNLETSLSINEVHLKNLL